MMAKSNNNRTVAEFFAGIGLMRAGLEQSGWKVAVANDIDPVKRRLYVNHFVGSGEHFLLEDIHNLTADTIPDVELATASFPCTDLSLAGRRAGLHQGKQSSAFWGFVNVLQEMGDRKPPLILLENVTGFLTSNGGQDFKDALVALNKQGYTVDAFIINAAHFVPQSRVRLFIVGKLTQNKQVNNPPLLQGTQLRPDKLTKFIRDNPDIKWDINHSLPLLPPVNSNLSNIVEKPSKNSKIWWSQERVDYLLNQTFDRHLSKITELKDKETFTYLTAFRRVRNGRSMAEIRFDGIAGCLRTPKGGSARQILLEVGKGQINVRLLTPKECARLMGAGNFNLSGSTNEALFGFGDAVCVPVISWIADNYLNNALTELINTHSQTNRSYAITA